MPVKGGAGATPTLRVVHVAAEMAPIAKVGAGVEASGLRVLWGWATAWQASSAGPRRGLAVLRRPRLPPPRPSRPPATRDPNRRAPPQEGGLGDVVTALGRAVQEEGHEVEVVLPKYDCINYGQVEVSRPLRLGRPLRASAAGAARRRRQRRQRARGAAPHAGHTLAAHPQLILPSLTLAPPPPLQDLRMVKDYWMNGVQVGGWA